MSANKEEMERKRERERDLKIKYKTINLNEYKTEILNNILYNCTKKTELYGHPFKNWSELKKINKMQQYLNIKRIKNFKRAKKKFKK